MMDKVQYDFGGTSGVPASGVISATTTSASASVPAGTELLAVTVSANCFFRIGVGAQTATITDPMLTPSKPVVIKLQSDAAYTIAAICPAAGSATISFARVFEA